MEILIANESIYHEIESFLKHIPSIELIHQEVIAKSVLLWDEQMIKGIISYEIFGSYGLIRYFIFQKDIEREWVEKLFSTMIDKAKTDQIKMIISLVQKNELLSVFESLGFETIPTSYFYLNETPLLETQFSDSYVMIYEIKNDK